MKVKQSSVLVLATFIATTTPTHIDDFFYWDIDTLSVFCSDFFVLWWEKRI